MASQSHSNCPLYLDPEIKKMIAEIENTINDSPQPSDEFISGLRADIDSLWRAILKQKFSGEGYFINKNYSSKDIKNTRIDNQMQFFRCHLFYYHKLQPPYWHGLTLVCKEPDYGEIDDNNRLTWKISRETWHHGFIELSNALSESTSPNTVYGGIVIGNQVRFYKFDGPLSTGPRQWYPVKVGRISLSYNIADEEQAQMVWEILNLINLPQLGHDVAEIIDCCKRGEGVLYKATYLGNDKWNESPQFQKWNRFMQASDKIRAFHAAHPWPDKPKMPDYFKVVPKDFKLVPDYFKAEEPIE